MSVLTLREVTKRFAGVTVVDRVSVDINPGEVHVLLGENGAGKIFIFKLYFFIQVFRINFNSCLFFIF